MNTSLQDHVIFLHGPSGAGKSEIEKKLTKHYQAEGYHVTYVSSGDLFRAAQADPQIAEQMRQGFYIDTLGAVIPGLKDAYTQFLQQWRESEGKAVIILDGVLRRTAFENQRGEYIPSQVDQIGAAFAEVRNNMVGFGQVSQEEVSLEVATSKHIVIEIAPADAEAQIKRRAYKETANLQKQISEGIQAGTLPLEVCSFLTAWLQRINIVLDSEVNGQADYESLNQIAQAMRKEMGIYANNNENASLVASFDALGFTTQLRDDDVSPKGRKSRVGSYIKTVENGNGSVHYEPGFIVDTLTTDLGFEFSPDGTISTSSEGNAVIPNGQAKEINLETFQALCEKVGAHLVKQTEETRQELFRDPEVSKKSIEK